MARTNVDGSIKAIGGNRFDLVVVASHRARAISRGSAERTAVKGSSIEQSLDEIEKGLYTKQEFIEELQKIEERKKDRHHEYYS